ncbi:unnamed protein product [Paramecium pentaurelia]|uniref:Uncharacterized protein n=1 Tax=Paramecium pentaurelia TaxID=43138 RepID=A0A8S1YJL3_9CILI|nr:unnamed protein product [Paramecium pentaurelia]
MLTTEVSATSNQKQIKDPQELVFEFTHQWTDHDEEQLKQLYLIHQGNWKSISLQLNGPSPQECMMKWQRLHPNQTFTRQLWSQEEDEQLQELVQKYGKKWSKICTVMNWRTGKQVRERYLNQLQGHINSEKWTEQEDRMILKLYKKYGTKWSYISSFLNGRPENMVKNRFYANLKRRFQSDLEISEDDQCQDSQDSLNITKYKKKKKLKPYRFISDSIQIKKSQLQNVRSEIFKRITRSKNKDHLQDQIKEEENIYDSINQNQEPINAIQNQEVIHKQEHDNQQILQQKVNVKEEMVSNNNQISYNPLMLFEYQQTFQALQQVDQRTIELGLNQQQQLLLNCYPKQNDTQFNFQLCQKCSKCENTIDQNQLYSFQDINQLFKLFQYHLFMQNQPLLNYKSEVDMSQIGNQQPQQYNSHILQ